MAARLKLASVAVGVVAALVAVWAVAVRGGSSASAAGGRVVSVEERDFQISVSRHTIPPGLVVFRVHNNGPDAHELIVVRDHGTIELRPDGMTVNEEGLAKQIQGSLEPGPAGDTRYLRVRLRPGRYMLLCNMYGHYMGGMHSVLVVE